VIIGTVVVFPVNQTSFTLYAGPETQLAPHHATLSRTEYAPGTVTCTPGAAELLKRGFQHRERHTVSVATKNVPLQGPRGNLPITRLGHYVFILWRGLLLSNQRHGNHDPRPLPRLRLDREAPVYQMYSFLHTH
jgi:hypothetical protein